MHWRSQGLRLAGLVPASIVFCAGLPGGPASAQAPHINTFYPVGGRSGTTVETEIRGASLNGAEAILVDRQGVTGIVEPGGAAVDNTNRPIWQAKCGSCHELRSPSNRSLAPVQWADTVDRMIKSHQAPISPPEAAKITQFLTSAARVGQVTAKMTIAPGVLPGIYQVRVVTTQGVSSVGLFEVGNLPEVFAAPGTLQTAPQVTLPCIANGALGQNGERHFFKFSAKKSQRLVFNFKGFRYRPESQMYFNPDLRLYDPQGNVIEENHGYFELDPLIDWTCPADGDYTLEVRDLLGLGNPASVYRLSMGVIPYDTVLFPPAIQSGATSQVDIVGKNMEGLPGAYSVTAPKDTGIASVGGPYGPQQLFVSSYHVTQVSERPSSPVTLPANIAGRVEKAGGSEEIPVTGDGVYEFDSYVARVGSPGQLRFTLLNKSGAPMAGMSDDGRMTARLDAGSTYTLKVEDAADSATPDCVYCVECAPVKPGLECVVRPDNLTLRPGISAAVDVILTRRNGTSGDIALSVENLPPGVTAAPTVIPPDRNEAWIVLTAADNAAVSTEPIRIVASGQGAAGLIETEARPQEIYRLNNDLHYNDRSQCVTAVSAAPDFIATVTSGNVVHVDAKNTVPIKIHIARKTNYRGPVTLNVQGLPSGWLVYQDIAGPDRSDVTLLVRPDGADPEPFLKRDAKLSAVHAVVIASADDFDYVAGDLVIVGPGK